LQSNSAFWATLLIVSVNGGRESVEQEPGRPRGLLAEGNFERPRFRPPRYSYLRPCWEMMRRMHWHLSLTVILLTGPALAAQDPLPPVTLRGRVIDALSGEPIAKALVSIRTPKTDAITDSSGRFVLSGIPAGAAEIAVTTVGYGPARRTVQAGADTEELEIRLSQEALRRAEDVAVIAAPFAASDPAAPTAHVLAGTELKNLANVLVDDPLRSVQSLPGVAASDDFGATFAARGLGFSNVGFYVDGVLMNAPFHTIRDINDGFSLTLVNGDMVESLSLLTGGAPAQYGDRIGSVLALETRDGSHEEFVGRASLGATGLYATLEGPLGAAKKTTWLVSARKSYLDYVLDRLDSSGVVLGFYDTHAKLTHSPSETQKISLGFLRGRSRWQSTETDRRPQDSDNATAGTDLATLQYRWLPSARTRLESVAFFSRETGRNRRIEGSDSFRSSTSQWGLRTDATRIYRSHRIEGGLLFRSLAEDSVTRGFDSRLGLYPITESYDVSSAESAAYVQDTWTGLGERLTATVGGRMQRFEKTSETRALPRASLTWRALPNTKVLAAFGNYAQFPAFEQLFGRQGNPDLNAERSTHYLLGVEHNLGASTRVRVEAYDQSLRGMPFDPAAEWRIDTGRIVGPRFDAPLRNTLSGHSRGIELMLQRRSANGLSGWIAYSFGHARWHDSGGLEFDSDFDQRHTLTAFGTYRISPTLNLSTKYRYGSGFPVPGFYESQSDGVFLSSERNEYRPEAYSRWDIRINKAFRFERLRLTLYGEVINVLNRTHTRYTDLDGLDTRTGRVFLESDTLFPLLPSVGVTIEF
jgi:TonB dependent receptor/Carboxypeptidase regulatory-like domain/TonB-dependent Receptor Plug Domain